MQYQDVEESVPAVSCCRRRRILGYCKLWGGGTGKYSVLWPGFVWLGCWDAPHRTSDHTTTLTTGKLQQ